jgi:neutral ceramidase
VPPPAPDPAAILVGTGISDITGPIAGVGMMGYGQSKQVSAGLHTRLYARAFAFSDSRGRRVVFVSADLGMIFSSVKQGVLRLLPRTLGYNDENVMLSATHTHSGPAGYSHHTLFNIFTGFVPENYDAIVQGIAAAILQADLTLKTSPANSITMAIGPVAPRTISVNRSIDAFRINPEPSEVTVLGIRRGGVPVAAISWLPVHPTSLPQHNLLVSSDNKGYASFLFERANGTIAPFQKPGGFVAAFPNGAAGDQSPNVTNTPPAPEIAEWTGPGGSDPFKSVEAMGERQYRAAETLFIGSQQTPVTGLIDSRHTFRLMPGMVVNTTKRNGIGNNLLCVAAYGEPFGAGTEDGRAGFLESAGGEARPITATELALRAGALPAVGALVAVLAPPLAAALVPFATLGGAVNAVMNDPCQLPKPNLIPTGVLKWTPEILPFQLLRLGSVAIAGFPGEMTVQAGRRLQTRITLALAPLGVRRVILTGYANEYSGYVTTPEEYDLQHYEGGSTLYGRLTFEAYLQIFGELADAMAAGVPVPTGPPPLDLRLAPQISLVGPVSGDGLEIGETFGEVLLQPASTVTRGAIHPVHVIFRSGHPRNDFRRNDSYFLIERDAGGRWVPEAWDAMPETKLFWGRPTVCGPDRFKVPIPTNPLPCKDISQIGIHWNVPLHAPAGQYRITHFGKWKNPVTGLLTTYQGTTNTFTVQ